MPKNPKTQLNSVEREFTVISLNKEDGFKCIKVCW